MTDEASETAAATDGAEGGAPRAATVRVKRFELGPFATNCYVLWAERPDEHEDEAAGDAASNAPPADETEGERDAAARGMPAMIVDAGWGAEALADEVERLGVRVERVVLTHAHADHIAGLDALLDRLAAVGPGRPPVYLHPAERDWLTDAELNLSAGFGMPLRLDATTEPLDEGEAVELAGVRFDVLHTPGHSPGGVCLHAPSLGVVVAGDTLFAGSIGRSDFPTSDGAALVAGIRERLYALPDDTAVLPGHGPTTTIGDEKRSNPFVRP